MSGASQTISDAGEFSLLLPLSLPSSQRRGFERQCVLFLHPIFVFQHCAFQKLELLSASSYFSVFQSLLVRGDVEEGTKKLASKCLATIDRRGLPHQEEAKPGVECDGGRRAGASCFLFLPLGILFLLL